MFEPITPDSYQPRLSNTPSLLHELAEIALRARESSKWQKHLEVLQAELSSQFEEDTKILDALPYFKWLASTFCTNHLNELVPLVQTVKGLKAEFQEQAEQALSKACDGLPRAKGEALTALRHWATMALQAGSTPAEMTNLSDNSSLDLPPKEFMGRIIAALKVSPSKMWCCLALVGPESDVKALSRKVGFETVPAKRLQNAEALAFKVQVGQLAETSKGLAYVGSSFEATTARDCAKLAIRQMRDAADVFNFYSEHNAIRIIPLALVEMRSGSFSITPLGDHELRKRLPRRARPLTLQTLDRIPHKHLDGRILNALEHYALAHASTATRVKLVNLWTALECLAGASDSAVENICGLVTPIVVWRRSDRLLTYTASCLQEYGKILNERTVSTELTGGTQTPLSREKLLLTLTKPKDHPEILNLLAFVGEHPLLRYRIFTLWETFSNPRRLAKELIRSQTRIRWHLYRIYRSRNWIVHEGRDTGLEQALLDNLHYYFSITLSRVLHGMQLQPAISVDESIANWRARSGYLIHCLENSPAILRVGDLFPKSYGPYAQQTVWP